MAAMSDERGGGRAERGRGSSAPGDEDSTALAHAESEARYRLLASATFEGITVHENGRHLDVNDTFASMLGYTREELIGTTVSELAAPESRATILEHVGSGSEEPYEVVGIRKDGTRVDLEARGRTLQLGDRTLRAAALRDITGQKRARERLRVLAAVGAELAASLEDGLPFSRVARIAVEAGVADACAMWHSVDDRVECVAGQQRNGTEVGGMDWGEQERGALDAVAEHVASRGTPLLVPDLRSSSGSWSARVRGALSSLRGPGYASALIAPMQARGRTLGVLALLGMSQSRRFAPDDLACAQELAARCALAIDNAHLYRDAQQAIAERDAFLMVAAHELKTPMTSVRAYAQLLERASRSGAVLEPAVAQRALRMIDQQTSNLDRLMRRLLDVTRLQSGHLSLEVGPTDLSALVTSVVSAAGLRAPRRTFALDVPVTRPIVVDALQMEQVLTNIVDNALKYSPEISPIHILLRDAPDHLELVVRDHGPGVPPERRGRLFERFYRAHVDSHTSGMGVGLYLSRQIVALHGGEIRAEFPDDGGARFVVRIPRSPDGPTGPSQP